MHRSTQDNISIRDVDVYKFFSIEVIRILKPYFLNEKKKCSLGR